MDGCIMGWIVSKKMRENLALALLEENHEEPFSDKERPTFPEMR